MHLTQFFGLLGGVLVLAFIANRLFCRIRIPDLIVLIATGLLLGPGLHWVDGNQFRTLTHVLGTLVLLLILFEGGLELNLRDALRHFPGGVLLAFIGYTLSVGLVATIARWLMKLPLSSSLLLGAVLGCTSSTMVMPALQQINVRDPVRITLLLEASLGDVLAVLTVGGLVDISEEGPLFTGMLSAFLFKITVSMVLAILIGVLWARVWPSIAEHRFANVVTFGMVLVTYSVSRSAGGSGLLAVLAFGLALANHPRAHRSIEHHLRMLTFHSELSFLARSLFFVLLGVVVKLVSKDYILPIIAILVALLAARAVAVQATRWVWREIQPRERELIFWMLPRGLITAVLALKVLEAKGDQFSFLPAMAFTVIMLTNLLVVLGSFRARASNLSLEGKF